MILIMIESLFRIFRKSTIILSVPILNQLFAGVINATFSFFQVNLVSEMISIVFPHPHIKYDFLNASR